MGTRASALGLLLLAVAAGCIAETERAVPLYDLPTRPYLEQVATLDGYVATVDGREVRKLGGAFELLPGCHLVTTPTHWGNGSRYNPVTANTRAISLLIPMLAGHHYSIVNGSTSNGAPIGVATLDISETDAAGHAVERSPTETAELFKACASRKRDNGAQSL